MPIKKSIFKFVNILKTKLQDVLIIEPDVYPDNRGYFSEFYNKQKLKAQGFDHDFIQDNIASSTRGVLRGLHFQKGSSSQAKLVSVLEGEIYDVCVDIRKGSQTFGQWEGFLLSENNKKQLFVPKGFAHGYLVLSEKGRVFYKVDNKYDQLNEAGLAYNDPDINIDWNAYYDDDLFLSEKDRLWPKLYEIHPQ